VAELSSLWRAMHFYTLPRAGWFSSMFANELPTFYFGQLVEFAPVYVFAYAAYIFLRKEISPEERFVQYVAMGNLFFYLIWGNFQSRYILSSVPFFLLLSAGFIYKWGKHLSSGNVYWRAALGPLLAAFVVYSVAKTHHINQVLSFTNNLCYF